MIFISLLLITSLVLAQNSDNHVCLRSDTYIFETSEQCTSACPPCRLKGTRHSRTGEPSFEAILCLNYNSEKKCPSFPGMVDCTLFITDDEENVPGLTLAPVITPPPPTLPPVVTTEAPVTTSSPETPDGNTPPVTTESPTTETPPPVTNTPSENNNPNTGDTDVLLYVLVITGVILAGALILILCFCCKSSDSKKTSKEVTEAAAPSVTLKNPHRKLFASRDPDALINEATSLDQLAHLTEDSSSSKTFRFQTQKLIKREDIPMMRRDNSLWSDISASSEEKRNGGSISYSEEDDIEISDSEEQYEG